MPTTREPIVGTVEAAKLLGRTPRTVREWRRCGKGPRYVRIHDRVLYRPADIAEWIDRHSVEPSDEAA